MDFIQWWFEKHYILSLIATPALTCIYSFYKGWVGWAILSGIIRLTFSAILNKDDRP